MRVSLVDQLRDTGRRVEELDARLAEQTEADPDRQLPRRRSAASYSARFSILYRAFGIL